MARPTQSFEDRRRKNDRGRSCWIMKRRTSRPAAGMGEKNDPVPGVSKTHVRPEQHERDCGDRQFEHAARGARLAVSGEVPNRHADIGSGASIGRSFMHHHVTWAPEWVGVQIRCAACGSTGRNQVLSAHQRRGSRNARRDRPQRHLLARFGASRSRVSWGPEWTSAVFRHTFSCIKAGALTGLSATGASDVRCR